MNNEQQQIIDKIYEGALMEYGFESLPSTPEGTWFETIETFIHKCKLDNEFSEKWGLKIEERELSLEERKDLYDKTDYVKDVFPTDENGWNKLFDGYKIPTKLITVIYTEKIESYV
jgi:hypothetical protein